MNPEHTAYYIETLGEKFIENGMIANNDTYYEFVRWMGPISPIGFGNHEDFMNCYVEEKKGE